MQIFDTNDSTTFFHNGRKYVKNFIAIPIGDEAIAVYNAYDTRLRLVEPTHYTEVQVNGVVQDSQISLMDALSPTIFAKGSPAGMSGQDNVPKYHPLGVLSGTGDITTAEVATWLNNQPFSLPVGETTTPTLLEFLRTENGGTKKYIFLLLRGKGYWGAAQGYNPNAVYSTSFKLISIQTLTSADVEDDENSNINYLGEIEDGDFVTVANESEWYFTGTTQQYYFSYTQDDVLYFALFVGTPNVYNGDFEDSDFVITTNSNVQPSTNHNDLQGLNVGDYQHLTESQLERVLAMIYQNSSATLSLLPTTGERGLPTNVNVIFETQSGDDQFITSSINQGVGNIMSYLNQGQQSLSGGSRTGTTTFTLQNYFNRNDEPTVDAITATYTTYLPQWSGISSDANLNTSGYTAVSAALQKVVQSDDTISRSLAPSGQYVWFVSTNSNASITNNGFNTIIGNWGDATAFFWKQTITFTLADGVSTASLTFYRTRQTSNLPSAQNFTIT